MQRGVGYQATQGLEWMEEVVRVREEVHEGVRGQGSWVQTPSRTGFERARMEALEGHCGLGEDEERDSFRVCP